MSSDTLRQEIEDYIRGYLQSEHVGFASVERFEGAPRGHHPADLLPGAKTVIVWAVSIPATLARFKEFFKDSELMPEQVETPAERDDTHWLKYTTYNPRFASASLYVDRYGYDWPQMMNQDVAFYLARWLERLGWYTLPVPGSTGIMGVSPLHHEIPARLSFSHRHAAACAGLGELGWNGLLLVPHHGPNIRICSAITTAEFEPSPLFQRTLCLGEECARCIKSCPRRAYGEPVTYKLAGREVTHLRVHWGPAVQGIPFMEKCSPDGGKCRHVSQGYCGECQFSCPADERLKDLPGTRSAGKSL